jgi:hypothetical protein
LSFPSDSYGHSYICRSDLLNEYNRLLSANFVGYPEVRLSTEAPSALPADLGSRFKSRLQLGLTFDVAVSAGK